MKILLTGGAGYIGSHVVRELGKLGHELVVYDNLSTGNARTLHHGRLVVAELADKGLLDLMIREFRPDAVIHFCDTIQVEEPVWDPPSYYWSNLSHTMNLLECMVKNGVRSLLFSSSAAVYGIPKAIPVAETAPLAPVNSYGTLKVMLEKILHGLSESEDFRYVSLRYFNVAGADPGGKLGRSCDGGRHLIDRALSTARGGSGQLSIPGAGFPTQDGTSIREYIHVTDLARAHVRALERLLATGASEIFNCGYGHGWSGREVADAARRVTGVDFRVEETDPQTGDPAALFVDSTRLKELTGWSPAYDDLDYIIGSAWEWEKRFNRKKGSEGGMGISGRKSASPVAVHKVSTGPTAQPGQVGYR